MANEDTKKVIMKILSNLHKKNRENYKTLNESDKTKYVFSELQKSKILFLKDSNESKMIDSIKKLFDEMQNNITKIYENNLYANNQTKLGRLNNNLNNILFNTIDFQNNIKKLKQYTAFIEKVEQNLKHKITNLQTSMSQQKPNATKKQKVSATKKQKASTTKKK